MLIGLRFAERLDPATRAEMESFLALLQGWSSQEHNDAGGHTDITATSIVTEDDASVGGDLAVDGDADIDGFADIGVTRIGDLVGSSTVEGALGPGIDINRAQDALTNTGPRLALVAWVGSLFREARFVWRRLSTTDTYVPLQIRDNTTDNRLEVMPGPVTNAVRPVHLGSDVDSSRAGYWSKIWAIAAMFWNGVHERGRTVAMGEWTAVAFNAGNFTGTGGMTWTVASGDQLTYAYTLVGKTLFVMFQVVTTTVGGVVGTDLNLAIPGGFTAARQVAVAGLDISDNGTRDSGTWVVTAGGSVIILRKRDLTNWTASADNTAISGLAIFEVQ